MSDKPIEPDVMKWFRESFPTENFLTSRITTQVNEVFRRVQMTTASIPIDMYQMRKEDGFSQLGMRDSAIMFYGVLAKTILDIISQNLATQLSPDFQQKLEETARVAVKEYISKNYPIRVEDSQKMLQM